MPVQSMPPEFVFTLPDGDRDGLNALAADRNTPQKHVWRARIQTLELIR